MCKQMFKEFFMADHMSSLPLMSTISSSAHFKLTTENIALVMIFYAIKMSAYLNSVLPQNVDMKT